MIVDLNTQPVQDVNSVSVSQYIFQNENGSFYPKQDFNPTAIIQQNKLKQAQANNFSLTNAFQIDIDKFINKLDSISARTSSARCARSIRIALQTAGAKFIDHPIAAADWGDTLEEIGYKQIQPSFDAPQEGDIYIIDRTRKHRYGHIAGYTGSEWVSDFKQRSYDVYKDSNVTYKYYRLG
ncbi:hypothetical protein RFI02_05005 [Acinetobacter sichuanensis]|uniref:hypothetical protein n=1 Tax=Acinetobacter sichuanensis TaxID=2136183 RepID=UPI00280FDA5D|nr:hypothetical protein [Acinetobacter sichuanensis]MDQ9020464.1 hypothetical protein [Acinetobacter sichuanensis]